VTVVVPWRPGAPERDAALTWVLERYQATHPTWRVVLGLCTGREWVKADAIADGLPSSGIVVVADADVWCDAIGWAVQAVASDRAAWAVPHTLVHRLTTDATAEVLAGRAPSSGMGHVQRPYIGTAGGGLVVMTAATAREVPMDRRFVGWGGEDGAWRDALRCLAGYEARGSGVLFHLWHRPQDRINRRIGSESNADLAARYAAARRDPRQMRALIGEHR